MAALQQPQANSGPSARPGIGQAGNSQLNYLTPFLTAMLNGQHGGTGGMQGNSNNPFSNQLRVAQTPNMAVNPFHGSGSFDPGMSNWNNSGTFAGIPGTPGNIGNGMMNAVQHPGLGMGGAMSQPPMPNAGAPNTMPMRQARF